jgi:hypothetical protein
MKMHLLVLESMAFHLCGVQLVSLIILSIGSLNQCFMNKVDELNESVPMDMDRVVVANTRDDMEIDNNPVEVDNDLQDLIEIHNDPDEILIYGYVKPRDQWFLTEETPPIGPSRIARRLGGYTH